MVDRAAYLGRMPPSGTGVAPWGRGTPRRARRPRCRAPRTRPPGLAPCRPHVDAAGPRRPRPPARGAGRLVARRRRRVRRRDAAVALPRAPVGGDPPRDLHAERLAVAGASHRAARPSTDRRPRTRSRRPAARPGRRDDHDGVRRGARHHPRSRPTRRPRASRRADGCGRGRDGRRDVTEDAEGWRRLDARMLLVHPLETLIRFLPALLALVVFRAGSEDNDRWELYAVPLIVAFGVMRWVTTRYRIADGQIELRRGLFTKQTTTARLDKVRTIDLTARVYHRVLGLAKVEISTAGGQHDRLVLDSLGVDAGRRLRAELLHRVDPAVTGLPAPTGAPVAVDDVPDDAPPPVDDEVLVRLDPSWIRYAPLTVTGLASAAAIVGFASQGFSRFSQERSVFRDGAS